MIEIRILSETDDRSPFRSGDADLDRFFHKFAGQNQFKHYIGATYVAVNEDQILGFATVAAGVVEIDALPATLRKKLPQYPLPVLRLARLAVASSAQGQGLGAQLLRFVFQLAMRMAHDFGCVGVVVDATPNAVEFYRRYGPVSSQAIEGQSDARPEPLPMFLAMRQIVRAAE